MTPQEVLDLHRPLTDPHSPPDYCSRCGTATSWPCDAVDQARQLQETTDLLREIKQNIDDNGPDRPDLYKRLAALLGPA